MYKQQLMDAHQSHQDSVAKHESNEMLNRMIDTAVERYKKVGLCFLLLLLAQIYSYWLFKFSWFFGWVGKIFCFKARRTIILPYFVLDYMWNVQLIMEIGFWLPVLNSS